MRESPKRQWVGVIRMQVGQQHAVQFAWHQQVFAPCDPDQWPNPVSKHRIGERRSSSSVPDDDVCTRTANSPLDNGETWLRRVRIGREGTCAARGRGIPRAREWKPELPRFQVTHLLLAWVVTAASVLIAAVVVPGVSIGSTGGAVAAAPVIALFNTLLPPLAAGLRVPYTLALGFVLVLVLEAAILLLVSSVAPSAIHVKSFGWALLAALVIAAAMAVLNSVLDANDD